MKNPEALDEYGRRYAVSLFFVLFRCSNDSRALLLGVLLQRTSPRKRWDCLVDAGQTCLAAKALVGFFY